MRSVLDNGLTVLLQRSRSAPVVALQLWVKVGSADELPHEVGLAHLHEHMLFKGTARRGPGEIARTVESCGGDINAWTSFDQTVYHLVVASDFFDEGLDVLADAVTGSVFDPEELAREIEVVCEEIRRGEDMPSRRVSRNLFRTAYSAHPYGRPVIGSEASVRSFTRDRILDFYARHYTAKSMVFVAVGDFDEERALDAIRRRFEGVRATPPGRRADRAPEPVQTAPRAFVEGAPVKEAYLSLAWHIPGLRSDEVAALDLLATLLGQGDASRLTLEVKRERGLVNDISASAYTPRDPGLFAVAATLQPAKAKEALAETLRQVLRARREEFTPEELARAKRILESDTIYQRETVQGLSRKMGFFEAVAGHVDEEERYLALVAAASAEDLRAVADKYLHVENVTLSAVAPADLAGQGVFTPDALVAEARAAEARLRGGVKRFPAKPYTRLTQAPAVRPRRGGEPFVRERLSSGATLLVREERANPLIAIRAAWTGGLRRETPADNGIHHLVARTLTRGTLKRSSRDVAREIDELAASLNGSAGRNSLGLQGEFLSADLERAFDLFADVLLEPAFDTTEVDRERALVLEELASREDHPASIAFSLFQSALWDRHPYRMDAQGSPASVRELQGLRLKKFYFQNYGLDGLVLSVVGDVSAARARQLAEQHFGGAAGARRELAAVEREGPLEGAREVSRRLDRKQAHLVVGFRGTTLDSPDRAALEVLSATLSGQGGRLFEELRDKRSLAYSVTSMNAEGVDPGSFAVYIGTSAAKVAEARAGIRRELDRVRDEPVSEAELARAVRHLVGSHAIGLQRLSARAAVLCLDEAYGLGAEHHLSHAERIRAVTRDDVQRVARRYLDFDRSVTALVSPDA